MQALAGGSIAAKHACLTWLLCELSLLLQRAVGRNNSAQLLHFCNHYDCVEKYTGLLIHRTLNAEYNAAYTTEYLPALLCFAIYFCFLLLHTLLYSTQA